jgi:hypothetical protein
MREVDYSQDFVNNLATVGCSRNCAWVRSRASIGIDTALDELNPWVPEASLSEKVQTDCGVGPSIIGVSSNDNCSSDRIRCNVSQDLLYTSSSGILVTCVGSAVPLSGAGPIEIIGFTHPASPCRL